MSTQPLPDMSQPGAQAPQAPPPSAAPAPGPHSRLLAMIQGLTVGVGAFAGSAATQGREGGPAEVQQFYANQQQEQLRAQQSQIEAQKAQQGQQEHDLRMQTMNANLLMQQAAYHHALQMYPTEEKESQLKVLNDATASYKDALSEGYDIADPQQAAQWRQMQQNIISIPFSAGQPQSEVLSSATEAAQKNGKNLTDFVPLVDYNDGKHGTGGNLTLIPASSLQQVQATPRQIAAGMAQMKSTLGVARTALGQDDPDVKALDGKIDTIQKVLDSGGKPSAYDFISLNSSVLGPLSTRIAGTVQAAKVQEQQAQAKKAVQDADPVFQANLAGQKKVAEDKADLPFAGAKAAAEASATQPYKVALANTEGPIRAGIENDEKAKENALGYVKGYVDKMDAVNELKSTVAQASQGNVAAARAALIKLTGLTISPGSKRLSPDAMREMQSMGTSGQKWLGSIQDLLTGDKWTPGMRQDVIDLANLQAVKARQNLSMGIHTLNSVRGTKLNPDEIIRSADQDQGWAQQTDSAGGGTAASGVPQASIGSKYGAPVH